MKTKIKSLKALFLLTAIISCCTVLNSSGQNLPVVVPDIHDFYGTWTGTDISGHHVTLTMSAKWNCSVTVDGVPNSSIISFRLPQYDPKYIATNGALSGNEVIMRFYTQDAIHNIPAPANTAVSTDNSLVVTSVPQVYSATAVITVNANPQTMELYVDFNNFSSVPPAAGAQSPDHSVPVYSLIKQ